jgi:uncharacterized protein (TIGR03435 family)
MRRTLFEVPLRRRRALRGRVWNQLSICALLVSLHLPVQALGQTPSGDAFNGKPLRYEVASVRPSKPGEGMRVSTEPSRLVMSNSSFLNLLFNAFPIRPHDDTPGMPSWGTTAEFDIDAKIDDDLAVELQKLPRAEQWQKRQLMLQALLADRFKMRFHFETREQPIYSLQIAKGGLKFKEVAEDDPDRGSSWGSGSVEVRGGSTQRLAFSLSDILGRMVRDDTGLTGRYHLLLQWTPEEKQSEGEVGPTIFTALQEQLGLKLVPTKGPVDTLVIDHVEKPSEN